jgi:hypothetical protein
MNRHARVVTMHVDTRLKAQWKSEWNHSDEFWCLLNSTGEVVVANSAFKEWFEINFDTPLLGITPGNSLQINSLEMHGDWQVVYKNSIMIRTQTRNDVKLIWSGGTYIGAIVKVTYTNQAILGIDEDLAQLRLDAHNGVTSRALDIDNVVHADFN